jgi:HK97 family phage prohead protease
MERKTLEIKSDSVIDTPEYCTFTGYAATFGNVDLVNDIIQKGAFAKCLSKKSTYPLYWDHSSKEMVGSVTVLEDENGLWVSEGKVNKGVARGRDVAALLKGGDLNTMSIGFMTKDFEYLASDNDDSAYPLRALKEIELREVSLVSDPANPMAKVASVKSLNAIRDAKSLADIEFILREHGIRDKSAKALVSKIKEFSQARDVPEEKAVDRDDSVMTAIYQTITAIKAV